MTRSAISSFGKATQKGREKGEVESLLALESSEPLPPSKAESIVRTPEGLRESESFFPLKPLKLIKPNAMPAK